jgi:hypothetical protein
MHNRRLNAAPAREKHEEERTMLKHPSFVGERVFALLFDAREKVTLTRYSGVFSPDDIASLDEYVAGFIAREGIYVRNIFDFTGVEAFGVSRPGLLERGRKLRTNPGQDRVVVAPQQYTYELFRDHAQAQLDIGNGTMMVVQRFEEALRMLRLHTPNQLLTRRDSLDL